MNTKYQDRAEKMLRKFQKNEENTVDQAVIRAWLSENVIVEDTASFTKADKEVLLTKIHNEIDKKRQFKQRKLFRYYSSVAAAILICISVSGYHYLKNQKINQHSSNIALNDVMPGSDAAVVELSNGQKIELDTAGQQNPEIGKIKVDYEKGIVSFENISPESTGNNRLEYNTISTHNASQYTVILPDGSIAKLNANSSIRFANNFKENRDVKIVGEIHFEVKRDVNNPFIVDAGFQVVKVLGTVFNIKSYPEENVTTTSLTSGSLLVQSKSNPNKEHYILKPGQSAKNGANYSLTVSQINIEKESSWKDGAFYFDGENIEEVLVVIARWYDVKIIFEYTPSNEIRYGGIISRDKKLSTVLSLLENQGDLKLTIKGKEVIVQQK